jgi:hypothetical protein
MFDKEGGSSRGKITTERTSCPGYHASVVRNPWPHVVQAPQPMPVEVIMIWHDGRWEDYCALAVPGPVAKSRSSGPPPGVTVGAPGVGVRESAYEQRLPGTSARLGPILLTDC